MKLREVLADVAVAEWIGDAEVEVADLAYDSRLVGPGTLFFCVRGSRADGHEFAPAAVAAGAGSLVVERPLELPGSAQARVADARAAMAPAARRFFADPGAELAIAGITGTNGKTTTAFLLRGILERAGTPTGLLGTVKRVVGGREEEVERTTPEAIDLQRTLRRMIAAGDRACAMEVSSHALALGRSEGIRFAVAAFTNLSQDHLDFHADMEDYFLAKRDLFFGSPPPGHAVVNVDDPYGARLAQELRDAASYPVLTFSAAGAEASYSARKVAFDAHGSRFVCATPEGEVEVHTHLPGDFNVANALTAIASAGVLGIGAADAAEALASAERVPGRLEPIDAGQDFAVLVDYAHTPDSLANVLDAARRLTSARLVCVFGAGGDRDREKRPLMGEIAARLADRCVVTSDNPRSERPEAIIAEIMAGIPGGADSPAVEVEPDRRAAIELAVETAEAGDTIVIAGKGHEQGQEHAGGRKVAFDDREVAREALERRGRRDAA